MVDLGATFDATNALASMFLWLLFGYLSVLLNCDLQRLVRNHPLILHLVGILAFFFLFTLIDTSNNTSSVLATWLKTLFLYMLFMLLIKSKWYFVVPILVLLLVDQTLKKDVAYRKQQQQQGKVVEAYEAYEAYEARIRAASTAINVVIILLAVAGTVHYAVLQKRQYKKGFSWFKFFFGFNKCKQEAGRRRPS